MVRCGTGNGVAGNAAAVTPQHCRRPACRRWRRHACAGGFLLEGRRVVKEIEILRNPWCVEDRVQCGATGDIALARRNPLPRYEAADVSLDVRESHSSIFPAR